jgi:hypothetical protein
MSVLRSLLLFAIAVLAEIGDSDDDEGTAGARAPA